MHRTLHVRTICAVLAALLCSATAVQAQEPATRPATPDARQRVLVVPFESVAGGSDADAGLARTIARSLVVDLSRLRSFHTVGAGEVAADQAAARQAGKAEHARWVVWGTVQHAEGRIRITGQVLDVERDEPTGHFKLTGSFRELFELQDLLADQVRRRLGGRRDADARGEAPAAEDDQAPPASAPAAEVPSGKPLRVLPHALDPDWLAPADPFRGGNDLRYRYAYGHEPYWSVPYTYGVWPFGYGYGYGGYHQSFYRPYRPLHQHRYSDYTFRGIPDRRSYRGFGPRHLRSFLGPVPLRWHHVD